MNSTLLLPEHRADYHSGIFFQFALSTEQDLRIWKLDDLQSTAVVNTNNCMLFALSGNVCLIVVVVAI